MSDWGLLFLAVWFLGTGAGTALGILLVRGGSMKPDPLPDYQRHDRPEAA